MERVTLLLNHVLAAEPAAVERLRRHSRSSVQVEFAGWPSWLPPLPKVAYRITPAGLLEWLGDQPLAEPELRIGVVVSNPALSALHLLNGRRPEVTVDGDATLAGDVNWLIDNLRWDLEDDLAQLIGPGPAHQLGRLMRGVAEGLRKAARSFGAAGAATEGPRPALEPLRR
ncbi:MAG: hypothetical protein ACJ8G7_10380 [Rhizobacter sp.]